MAQPDVMKDPALYQQKAAEAFFNAFPLLLKVSLSSPLLR